MCPEGNSGFESFSIEKVAIESGVNRLMVIKQPTGVPGIPIYAQEKEYAVEALKTYLESSSVFFSPSFFSATFRITDAQMKTEMINQLRTYCCKEEEPKHTYERPKRSWTGKFGNGMDDLVSTLELNILARQTYLHKILPKK